MTDTTSQASARVAIVTGAARGIGAATAIKLGQDGFAVAVLDLDESTCKDTVEQVTAAVDRVAAELGPPVVLVNNAGVIRDNLLFKMTDDDWDTVLGVHLKGAFLMSRATQAHMTA